MIKKILYILVITSLWAPLTQAASAVFTTYPTHTLSSDKWIVRDVNPGQHYENHITVENLLDKPISLHLEIIESVGSRKNIRLLENQPSHSIGQWIDPEATQINLNAKEKKNLKLNIQIPSEAKLGEYQAVALISHSAQNTGGLNISTRIGNRIYLNVTDQVVLQANTFTPGISPLQMTLILLALAGITYGLIPARKLTNQKSLS